MSVTVKRNSSHLNSNVDDTFQPAGQKRKLSLNCESTDRNNETYKPALHELSAGQSTCDHNTLGSSVDPDVTPSAPRQSTSDHSVQGSSVDPEEIPAAPVHYNGLQNLGATCYLNAVLQTLFMTEEFRKAVERRNPGETTVDQLKKLFLSLKKGRARPESEFLQDLDITNKCEQQDAAEYFQKIVNKSNICGIYHGTLRNCTKCLKGDHESGSEDSSFVTLPLALSDYRSNIDTSWEAFFKTSVLDGDNQMFCDLCGEKTDTEVSCEIKSYPNILTLHLKRFYFDYNWMMYRKNDCVVEIPLKKQVIKEFTYELYAIINHSGTLQGGHYYSLIKSFENGKWYDFNDTYVSESEPELRMNDKMTIESRKAYVLLYKKQNMPENRPESGRGGECGQVGQGHFEVKEYEQTGQEGVAIGGGECEQTGQEDVAVGGGECGQTGQEGVAVGSGECEQTGQEGVAVGGGEYEQTSQEDIAVGGGACGQTGQEDVAVGGGACGQTGQEDVAVGSGEYEQTGQEGVAVGGGECGQTGQQGVAVGGGECRQTGQQGVAVGGGECGQTGQQGVAVGGGECGQTGQEGVAVGGGKYEHNGQEDVAVGGGECGQTDQEDVAVGGGECGQTGQEDVAVGGGEYEQTGQQGVAVGGGECGQTGQQGVAVGGGECGQTGQEDIAVGGGKYEHNGQESVAVGGGECRQTGQEDVAVGGGECGQTDQEDVAVGGGKYEHNGQESVAVGGGECGQTGQESVAVGGEECGQTGQESVAVGGEECGQTGQQGVAVGRGECGQTGQEGVAVGGPECEQAGQGHFEVKEFGQGGVAVAEKSVTTESKGGIDRVRDGACVSCTGTSKSHRNVAVTGEAETSDEIKDRNSSESVSGNQTRSKGYTVHFDSSGTSGDEGSIKISLLHSGVTGTEGSAEHIRAIAGDAGEKPVIVSEEEINTCWLCSSLCGVWKRPKCPCQGCRSRKVQGRSYDAVNTSQV